MSKKHADILEKAVPHNIICKYCNLNYNCRYRKQFKNLPNIVIAPSHYLGKPQIKDFNPDIIFIDESINSYDKFEKKTRSFRFPNKPTAKWYMETYSDIYPQDKWPDVLPDIISDIKSFEFDEKFPNSPHNIGWYPLLYYVFEYSDKNIPIVFMDATFEISLFKYLLKRYIKEKNCRFKPSIKIWCSKVENTEDSVIFVPFPTRGFYKSYIWNHKNPTIREILGEIFKKLLYLRLDFGFITFKEYIRYMPLLSKMNYFGATSGLNEFENCDVLVVAGTYLYGEEENLELMKKIFNDPTFNVKLGRQIRKTWKPYPTITVKGKKYPNYPIIQAENEQWDTVMRIRPYSRKKYVILLGYIADRFKNKLNYQELSTNQKKINLDKIFGIIENYIFKNNIDVEKSCNVIVDLAKGIAPSKVAENYKITTQVGNKKRPDTQRIRNLKNLLP